MKNKDKITEGFNIDDALVWCQTCRHGGHLKHIAEWFEEFTSCPVTDCPCQCSLL
jgi:WD repeat-containing protein mio